MLETVADAEVDPLTTQRRLAQRTEERNQAVLRMQGAQRQRQARAHATARRQHQHLSSAATRVQTAYRGTEARARVVQQRAERAEEADRQRAVTILQSVQRRGQAQERARVVRQARAAVALQNLHRRRQAHAAVDQRRQQRKRQERQEESQRRTRELGQEVQAQRAEGRKKAPIALLDDCVLFLPIIPQGGGSQRGARQKAKSEGRIPSAAKRRKRHTPAAKAASAKPVEKASQWWDRQTSTESLGIAGVDYSTARHLFYEQRSAGRFKFKA